MKDFIINRVKSGADSMLATPATGAQDAPVASALEPQIVYQEVCHLGKELAPYGYAALIATPIAALTAGFAYYVCNKKQSIDEKVRLAIKQNFSGLNMHLEASLEKAVLLEVSDMLHDRIQKDPLSYAKMNARDKLKVEEGILDNVIPVVAGKQKIIQKAFAADAVQSSIDGDDDNLIEKLREVIRATIKPAKKSGLEGRIKQFEDLGAAAIAAAITPEPEAEEKAVEIVKARRAMEI